MRISCFARLMLWAVIASGLIGSQPLRAENWPGWRGASGVGISEESDLPLTWDGAKGENVLWKVRLHGGDNGKPTLHSSSWSSPIVWGDRVFVTTATWSQGLTDKEREAQVPDHHLICFKAGDGELVWDTVIPHGKWRIESLSHGYATPTPVTDGTHVFALFGSAVLAAVDFDGQIVWREELPRSPGEVGSGICSSPILYEEMVIIPGLMESGLRALDKQTGEVRWEQKVADTNRLATPAIIRVDGQPQLIHNVNGVLALDPTSGDLLWSCRATSSHSSVVFGAGLVYVDAGNGGDSGTVVDPSGQGDVTKTHLKWQAKIAGAGGSSAIIVGPHLYRVSNPGVIRCWDVESGKRVYEERAPEISPSASPFATADGRIYFASSSRTYVIKAGPEYEELGVSDLGDNPDYSCAAAADGRIFIKGSSYLWCLGQK